MSELPILSLCDDQELRAKEWADDLRELDGVAGVYDVLVFDEREFRSGIETLQRRRTAYRSGSEPPDEKTLFDRSEVLIVDYDLFCFERESQRTTGDEVAYLARCFSRAGFIVGVNLDRVVNPFDLTLTDHPFSFVDLALGGAQVAHPGLWALGEPDEHRFRPWAWPLVPERASAQRLRADRLESQLDRTVAEVLGLQREITDTLGRRVVQALEMAGGEDPFDARVDEWVASSAFGPDEKDKLASPEAVASVASARLAKWLEWVLLPGQDVLVDAPHLIERRPGLLTGESERLESWNGVCTIGGDPMDMPLDVDRLAGFEFEGDWLSRPAWVWPTIAESPDIEAARKAARPEAVPVFAEDASCFLPRASARTFIADVDAPFAARWVAAPESGVSYRPQKRLAIAR